MIPCFSVFNIFVVVVVVVFHWSTAQLFIYHCLKTNIPYLQLVLFERGVLVNMCLFKNLHLMLRYVV